ncbi:hypothetical protein [Ulvibacterium sp.]|uniref:hypothetical protein n=1 Tax=Ulvibacterium sp. TaxID=2665914 RepID=UPI003BA95D27
MLIQKRGLQLTMFMFLSGILLANSAQGLTFQKDICNLIVHPFLDTDDPLSEQRIIEHRDANGLSLYFSRKIDKPVCLSKTCLPLSLIVLWDGAGNFKGLEFTEGEPLTKTDHTDFTKDDYRKLNKILSNKSSVLGMLQKEDLILEDKRKLLEDGVDAYSGATQPSLYDQVVRDAVYTCYTLWNTAYGATQRKILAILDQKADGRYLNMAFQQNETGYLLWAIDHLTRYPEYHKRFYRKVTKHIRSENNALAQRALDYFTPARMADLEVQKALVQELAKEKQLDVIWKLTAFENLDGSVIEMLLQRYKTGKLDVTELGYVLKMITGKHLANPNVEVALQNFLNDNNRYVRHITLEVLKKYKK